MKKIPTPYYLIDEKALLKNLKKIQTLKEKSGVKVLLALKCFSTWQVFALLRQFMDGTTGSSLFEAHLGYEKFGGETHAFSVGYDDADIKALRAFSDKIIFNSIGQLNAYYERVKSKRLGLRINPSLSFSHFDLADPARKFSRLGESDIKKIEQVLDKISGAMFHYNCENDDFEAFALSLETISKKYSTVLKALNWVSLGGGIAFTKDGYPLDKFARLLKDFSEEFCLQVYLEPGEAAISGAASLITTVLDIVENQKKIAIVDASVEAHMLDLLIYRQEAKVSNAKGKNEFMIAGRSCLAGDIFGTYRLKEKLRVGSEVHFADAAGYTMVKKNWFNGLAMPAIVIKRLSGKVEIVQSAGYQDFLDAL